MSNITIQQSDNHSTQSIDLAVDDFSDDIKGEEKIFNQSEKLNFVSRHLENDSQLSTTDICRICHMGGFPILTVARPIWEWNNKQTIIKSNNIRICNQESSLSLYDYLGPLISACKCRGTVGLVHVECLERWLTESGHTRCELCGFKFITKRVPRHGVIQSIWIWFKTVIATRQMLLDIMYMIITTPLALFSIYICGLALRMILDNGFNEIPWIIFAMLPTCLLTLFAYWSWILTLGRYIRLHGRRWRRFWRNNFIVRLLPDDLTAQELNENYQENWNDDEDNFNEELFERMNDNIFPINL